MLLNNRCLTKVAKSVLACSKKSLLVSGSIVGSKNILFSSLQSVPNRAKATLPDLPYDYSALEPVITAEIMQLHHSKPHQTYVNNYNVASEKLAEAVEKGKNFQRGGL